MMQKKGIPLIDVRPKNEYDRSHPTGAKSIPVFLNKKGELVYNKEFIDQVNSILEGDIDKPIMIICRNGSKSKYAANILTDNGYSNVYGISHGFATKNGWKDSKLPIQK